MGAIAGGVVHYQAPQFAEVVVGMLVAALSQWILGTILDTRKPTTSTARPATIAGAEHLEAS